MTTSSTTAVPTLTAGTWTIDPSHSEVGFTVRHLMVSKIRGSFKGFSGAITVSDDPLLSAVEASIDVTSVTTNDDNRDVHLRSADFFHTENHPTMTYRSTGVRSDGGDYLVDGELTLHGVTLPVQLRVEFNGVSPDPWGGTRAGFSAETEVNRKDFGIDFNIPLDGGGVVVGEKVKVHLEIEATLATA